MRLGSNPLKSATVAPPARVVVLVITHLPEMESEYHRTRLNVIGKSLYSLVEYIGDVEHDIIIWDNGSCDELREFLRENEPDRLILSNNIGKTNALKSVMRMLPPDTILAYGDDDMEYFPNWLTPQIEILETFPKVGTVTGWPVRITGTWAVDSVKWWTGMEAKLTERNMDRGCKTECGRLIPDEWERDYCESVGRDWDDYKTATWAAQDFRITYQGVQAYAMSQHCQFVCYPERVEPLIPWTDRAMQDELEFDKAVDAAGLLRLATVERLTRHIGNILEPTPKGE